MIGRQATIAAMNASRPPRLKNPPPRAPRQPAAGAGIPAASAQQPLGEAEMAELDALLGSLPPQLESLDVVMLDGYLCGVLLQPRPVPEAAWLARITDLDAKPPPAGFDSARLAALAAGRLQAVLPDWEPVGSFGEHLYAIRPYSPYVPRAVQALVAHLRESLRQGFASAPAAGG